jgi:RNA polymerase sporulation-specific sigma factor
MDATGSVPPVNRLTRRQRDDASEDGTVGLQRPSASGRRSGCQPAGRSEANEQLLLGRARAGDRHAERLLICLYAPVARQICNGFFVANGDASDLLQVARIGVWKAIRDWDPVRGPFRAFAALVMRREVMMLVSTSRTHSQRLLSGACSLDDPAGTPALDPPGLSLAETLAAPPRDANDPAQAALIHERLQLILEALPALSEHERGSLSMALNDHSHGEIGAALSTDAKSVNNALQRARRKLSTLQ